MNRRLLTMLLASASLAVAATSCIDKEGIGDRLDKIEDRIETLEGAVSTVNDNALAVSALLKDSTIILSFEKTNAGYELELSDGTTVKVVYGKELPGVTPIIGIDADGRWTMSIDNGETFTVIPECATGKPAPAVTPQIKIDADGYWCYSMDAGKTWKQVLGADGKPISATDGKEVSGGKTYFSDVNYDADKGIMNFTLIDGSSFSVKTLTGCLMTIVDFKGNIKPDETLVFEVEAKGVAETAIQAPEGWIATLTDTQFTVTAPADAEAGEYEIRIILVSTDGFVKTLSAKFLVG